MWLVTWLGCGPGTAGVDWDVTTASDAGEDVIVAVLLLGVQETDGAVLRAVHPAGSRLKIRALPRAGQGRADAWTARAVDEDVVRVARQEPTSSALDLTLAFAGEGTTDLAVVDGSGTVLDTEVIEVREVAAAEVLSWEDARRGVTAPLDALHVAEGTSATFVVRWSSASGEPMAGGDLLRVDAPAALGAEAGFDGTNEILRVAPAPGSAGGHEVALSAGGALVRTVPVVVHARDEVDAVGLELGDLVFSKTLGDWSRGTAFSVVRAGDDVLAGAELVFTWPEGSAEGDTIDFAATAGPATEVEACFDEVCATFPLPAGVVEVRDEEADLDVGDCSCGHAGGAPLPVAAAGAALLLLRRRRARP